MDSDWMDMNIASYHDWLSWEVNHIDPQINLNAHYTNLVKMLLHMSINPLHVAYLHFRTHLTAGIKICKGRRDSLVTLFW